jgi:small subunit ribosomal protein S3
MGQKVNPVGFRTGIMIGWKSRWYASKKEFADLLIEDKKIRTYVKGRKDKFGKALYPSIAKIEIERTRDEVKVILFSARPGILIGRKGERVEELQKELQEKTGRRINLKIEEINRPEIVAQLVAEDIAEQLERRSGFRRTMKRSMEQTMEAGAKGIKIQLSGRLGGAEMSRRDISAPPNRPAN